MRNNKEAPVNKPALSSIYKQKLSEAELREIEARLDQMLVIAWAVLQTIAKEPGKLADIRRHLTELGKESTIGSPKGREETKQSD